MGAETLLRQEASPPKVPRRGLGDVDRLEMAGMGGSTARQKELASRQTNANVFRNVDTFASHLFDFKSMRL